jgi:RES domain-containing protein
MLTPHADFDKYFKALGAQQTKLAGTLRATVFRAGLPRYMCAPYSLTAVGAVLNGGRWNVPKLMPALYFGNDPSTAMAEVYAEAKRNGYAAAYVKPQTIVPYTLDLKQVLDLRVAQARTAIGVSIKAMIACPWHADQLAGNEPLTQAIARAAFELGIEALIVPSARHVGGSNVVVFPAKLLNPYVVAIQPAQVPLVHGLP